MHNLKNIDADVPLHELVAIAGVSGSGKTTLILESLVPALQAQFTGKKLPPHVISCDAFGIKRVNLIDSSSIGANVRSTVATYAGVLDGLRKAYAIQRAVKPIELPRNQEMLLRETYVSHDAPAYESAWTCVDTLSLPEMLSLTVDQALCTIEHLPSVVNKLQTLHDLGLGYLTLGEATTVLSGGGEQGGRIVCAGTPERIVACPQSKTGCFIGEELA